MSLMRAAVVDELIEPEALVERSVSAPRVQPGEVLIQVRAAGCNFSDVLMLRGRYQEKPALPFIPGREAAGVVVEVGADISDLQPGDRVMAYTHLGAFAEQVAVDRRNVHLIPDTMPFEEAAAMPIVYPTSHAALVDRAGLRAGETLLVHAAAGGVGLAAVQIGRALGARVIATAGGSEKLEIARAAGADVLIDYRQEDFVAQVLEATAGRGADVIYDSVGGDTTDGSLRCIAWKGRLIVVGFAGGTIPEIRANRIMLKNISVVGLHWPVYGEKEPETVRGIFADLMRLYDEGRLTPLIQKRYPLSEAGAALSALATRRTVGKVVIEP